VAAYGVSVVTDSRLVGVRGAIYDFIKSRVVHGREVVVSAVDDGTGRRATPRLRAVVTVQHATLAWLRDQIATGVCRPGDQLRQEVLAREFGVSVPPVREALKTLEAEGQVVYAPHRGYFVASMSYRELAENYRIRELLETEAIGRSVPVLGAEDVERMGEAVRDMERAHRGTDLHALTSANRRFHFTLFDAADMPRMADMIRVLWESTDRYRSLYFSTRQHRLRVNAEHREILAAVREHDAPAATTLLRAHRERALRALKETFESAGADRPGSP
jgi:DNA-binding GntR family transcriptional regulator